MTITKQQLIDKYNEVYAADNGVNKTFVELTKDEKVEALLQFVTSISGGSGEVTPFTMTLSISTKTNSGSIASGARSIAFGNTGNANITLAGGTITPGTVIEAPIVTGGTYNAVAYNATDSSLLVVEVR